MKDIDSFFKQSSKLYQSALRKLEVSNFVYSNPTAILPSNHYRFEISNERNEYGLLDQRKYHLDYKLLEIFIKYQLCDNKPYRNISDQTKYYALLEQGLIDCSEDNAAKITQSFSTYIDQMLEAWPQETKKKFKNEIGKYSFSGQLTAFVSYDCYPYEIVLIAKDQEVQGKVKKFLDQRNCSYRAYLYIGIYRSHTFRISIAVEAPNLALSLLTELNNFFQPLRLRYRLNVEKIDSSPLNEPEPMRRRNREKSLLSSHFTLKFVDTESKKRTTEETTHVEKKAKV